jgi:hypothetical protein
MPSGRVVVVIFNGCGGWTLIVTDFDSVGKATDVAVIVTENPLVTEGGAV